VLKGCSVALINRTLSFPNRKISETFLDFAEPLLDAHGPRATAAQMEQSLQLAFTIWNAVVYEDAAGNRRFIDSVRKHTAHESELAAFVEQLIARKRSLFGDDHRLVGEFKLRREGDEWRLRAEARDPTTSSRGTE
jgi:predicted hotdog family 3-hydroxylacyl-ACP dehydratase